MKIYGIKNTDTYPGEMSKLFFIDKNEAELFINRFITVAQTYHFDYANFKINDLEIVEVTLVDNKYDELI